MKFIATLACVISIALAALGTPVGAKGEDFFVSGVVVDEQGKAVEGVGVDDFWGGSKTGMQLYDGVKTDTEGKFKLAVDAGWFKHFAITAITADNTQGAQARIAASDIGKELRLVLGPLSKVSGTLVCPDFNNQGCAGLWPLVSAPETRTRVANVQTGADGTFAFLLPPGTYALSTSGGGDFLAFKARPFTLESGKAHDFGVLNLELSPLGKLYGKVAPEWTVTDARGLEKTVKIADFRGKWLLIDFWYSHCGPCLGRGIPNLIHFHDEHKAESDQFQCIAFHNESEKDIASAWAEVTKTAQKVIDEKWHGHKEIPFPILLDATGATMKTYGIVAFPTLVVIDPEGKVVKGGTEEYVAERLKEAASADASKKSAEEKEEKGTK